MTHFKSILRTFFIKKKLFINASTPFVFPTFLIYIIIITIISSVIIAVVLILLLGKSCINKVYHYYYYDYKVTLLFSSKYDIEVDFQKMSHKLIKLPEYN